MLSEKEMEIAAYVAQQVVSSNFSPGTGTPGRAVPGTGKIPIRLNGYPDYYGDQIVYKGKVAVPFGDTASIKLKPRQPVLMLGMVTVDPTVAAGLNFTKFQWSGQDVYADGGENSEGIVKLPDPADFTWELLFAKANPFPRQPLLLDNANSLELELANPATSGADVEYSCFFYGIVVPPSLASGAGYTQMMNDCRAACQAR